MPSNLFEPIDGHGARPVKLFPENQITRSDLFTATHSVAVGTATAVTVLITIPATDEYMVRVAVDTNDAVTWTFSTGPTASGGTAITAANNNRGSSATLGATVTHTATYVASGTVLETHYATTGIKSMSGWWQLAASTLYLVRGVVTSSGTVNVNIEIVERDT